MLIPALARADEIAGQEADKAEGKDHVESDDLPAGVGGEQAPAGDHRLLDEAGRFFPVPDDGDRPAAGPLGPDHGIGPFPDVNLPVSHQIPEFPLVPDHVLRPSGSGR